MAASDDEKRLSNRAICLSSVGSTKPFSALMVDTMPALEWFIDRYRVTRDRESGIVNNPNGWFDAPEDLVSAICRIVHVSVETARIVAGLPAPFAASGSTPPKTS